MPKSPADSIASSTNTVDASGVTVTPNSYTISECKIHPNKNDSIDIRALVQKINISESLNGSPYIGNIHYRNGFATITHPKYYHVLSGSTGEGTIDKLKFQGTHQMYEHEYQCTVNEHEFNQTQNISTREIKSNNNYKLAGFTSSSYFKPYVTTIGLYNESGDCLVVGKLGQPIKMSNETDTTFILRWDT